METLILTTALASLALFIATFIIATLIKNNGIVDIIWGLGFVVISVLVYFHTPNTVTTLIMVLTTMWGIRLATHIALRNLGQKEDFRYAQWRKDWGKWWLIRSFFQVYLLQWLFMQIVSVPIVLGASGAEVSKLWLVAGFSIWLIGFYFEAVGDYQLTVFKSKKTSKGKLMTTGLWRYTRHPNYFGEATLWWGIALIAYAASGNLLAFVGPLMIDFLLLKVSGIPMLEAKYKGRKDWEAYAKKTSAFFPLPPKS
jgi:steroid 5-alpha reductase family enzyme